MPSIPTCQMLSERLNDFLVNKQKSPIAFNGIWKLEMAKYSKYFISQTEENLNRYMYEAGTPDTPRILPVSKINELNLMKSMANIRIKDAYEDINILKLAEKHKDDMKGLITEITELCVHSLLEMWSAVGQHDHDTELLIFTGIISKSALLPNFNRIKIENSNLKAMTSSVFNDTKMEVHSEVVIAAKKIYAELINEAQRIMLKQVNDIIKKLQARIQKLKISEKRDLTLVDKALQIAKMPVYLDVPNFDETSINKEWDFDREHFEQILQQEIEKYITNINGIGKRIFERLYIVNSELNRTDIFRKL